MIFATFGGPVLAVYVTRYIDKERQSRERQLGLFRALMGTRRAPLAAERVTALNLVEIEFYGVKPVETAYKAVINHMNVPKPIPDSWGEENRKFITKLLYAMAQELGYKLEQLDVLDGGYHPQGISDIETEQQEVRRSIIDVLSGRRPLLVSPAAPTPPSPFPPPPKPNTK